MIDIIEGQRYPRKEIVSCPFCGSRPESREIEVAFGMKTLVAECIECRIAFQILRPTPEASRAYMNWRWSSSDAYVADRDAQLKRASVQLSYVHKYIENPGKLMDIGAGTGAFAHLAVKEGWDVTGIEQSDAARSRAKEFYGVNLLKEIKHDVYQVITMWDVIEHLREPEKILSLIRKHLLPGGLVFIETGNYENWTRLVNRDKWGLYLFDHQYYFTPYSLERILINSGFQEFYLIPTNHICPKFQALLRKPWKLIYQWSRWLEAKLKWPKHGDINVMIAVARNPE